MIVEAVRDDGALLVSNGRQAAVVVAAEGTWLTTVDAALARGGWAAPPSTEPPEDWVDGELRQRLADLDAELDDRALPDLDDEPARAGGLVPATDFHPGGPNHKQSSHGNWARGAKVDEVVAGLHAGKKVSVSSRQVSAVMKALADGPPVNMANLQVKAPPKVNERCCFTRHMRDIPRSEMPQLPTSVEELKPFLDRLAERGVTAEVVEIDPRELTATQSELNGAKVGKLHDLLSKKGWKEGAVILASSDGAVVDGHHRWAAASSVAMTRPGFKIQILRINLPIDELLEVAQESSGPRAGLDAPLAAAANGKPFGGRPTSPPPDPNLPYIWFKDRWWLLATDTTDGVPESLDELDQGKADDGPITAAAEVHTGAMIALVPSDADMQRLAVPGGEPARELHCTLLYLGDAAAIPPAGQRAVINRVTRLVREVLNPDLDGPLVADGFAIGMFNPPGMAADDGRDRDPCVVLGLSGDDLAAVHDLICDVVDEVDAADEGWQMPAQHQPFAAHLTLAYGAGLGAPALASLAGTLVDRVGPVTFDRVRVAFAGTVTDIPLTGSPPQTGLVPYTAATMPRAVDAVNLAGDANLRNYWLRGAGAGKIRWGSGGDFTRCVRHLRKYVRDPKGLCAEYHHEATGMWPGDARNQSDSGAALDGDTTTMEAAPMDSSTDTDLADTSLADTDLAKRRMDPGKAQRGGCAEGQHRDPVSGGCVKDDDDYAVERPEHFHAVMHVEGVTTGMRTFTPGSLTWREPPFAFHWQRSSSAHNGQPETFHVGSVSRAARDGDVLHGWGRLDLRCAEGLEYARRLVEGIERWVSIGLDESLKDADVEYIWPEGVEAADGGMMFGSPEEIIFHAGRIAELSGVSVPAQAEATIEPTDALRAELAELGVLTAAASDEPIVAAGYTIEIPDCPPASWFDEPTDVTPHGALTITDEGRIYGYLAPDGVAHRSFPGQRVTVPMGRVDYDRWMGGEAIVAGGGRVVAGPITMECGHLPPSAASQSHIRMEHYDNACSVVAKARIGENRNGVWIAGALEPGVTADQVSRMLACRLSGDWAPHPEKPGWREFVAALVVPVPGFPQARTAPSVRLADGALVAAAVPVRVVHAGDDTCPADDGCDLNLRPVLERIAAGIGRDTGSRMQALHHRVHSGTEVNVNV